MATSREAQIKEYGWGTQPCDPKLWGGDRKYNKAPLPQLCANVPLPDTPVVKAAMQYAKKELPVHTFNHSMRVFYYGMSTVQLVVGISAQINRTQTDGHHILQAWLLRASSSQSGSSALRHGC